MSAVQLEVAAHVLGPLLEEVASRIDYTRLGERLRARGLHEAADEPVICRWRSAEPRVVIDVMPTDPEILGFSNQWYGQAITTAATVTLDSGAKLRAATPALLAATKLWACRADRRA